MPHSITHPQTYTAPRASGRTGLGDRVRQLRINRGLTQTDLAGDRFSKEYVSQIERGKTRPTGDTVEWLASRLGVDRSFLETGVSSSDRDRAEGVVSRAEAAIEAHEYAEAVQMLIAVRDSLENASAPHLELRALLAESWARMYMSEIRVAVEILGQARELAEGVEFTDVDRAEILFRLGCCRWNLSSIATASALFSEALELAERSGLPSDRLRSNILGWRSRCHQRQRDWEAAREDVERALELAEALDDEKTIAHHYFQASLIAERKGQSKGIYEKLADQVNASKLLNNLCGLNFLLGKPDEAVAYLKDAFRVALDVGSSVDAAYAVSSLAQVHLRTDQPLLAEEQARHALELLGDRVEFIDEIGNAQLVLGRSLLEQERLEEAEEMFDRAEESFEQLSSASHRAAAWVAKGDLAAKRGDDREAAHLYRRAAETLQDFRF
jgi:transcriptional regulator with XRE-family HTH domain/Tfp pilus assembly protein PilF